MILKLPLNLIQKYYCRSPLLLPNFAKNKMMKEIIFSMIIIMCCAQGYPQKLQIEEKKRLDFAKTYFELGGSYTHSFTGKRLINNELITFENAASITQYLNWGAFHFWGHAEFYVTFPLGQIKINNDEESDFELIQSVVTGLRILPWAFREKKWRPYVGISWSGLDFQQKIKPEENQPMLSKDFLIVPETGLMYGYKGFMLRLGINYIDDNKWNYPLSKTTFTEIETPKFNFQLGLNYAFENSYHKDAKVSKRWNNYPRVSKIGHSAKRFGEFFIGVGPSFSFSLNKSEYNQSNLPYLKDQLTSSTFFDFSIGYQFNRAGLFTALTFRAPEFTTEGFGNNQRIKKQSLALEINKFLTDYTGFAPFIGINMAYDKLDYEENIDKAHKKLKYRGPEFGFNVGWDIVPGKTDEALILRTNLRWYPFASFGVEGKKFGFSQLEYNLIQVVFYPERLKKTK